MSFLLTRPPDPVPVTSDRSTLCSCAMRRTSGEERTFSPGSRAGIWMTCCGTSAAGAGTFCFGASGAAFAGASAFFSAAGSGASTAAPSPSISATTVFTATVSFSFTMILVRTPAAGEGISASTLSVEISKSGSSRSTRSPTFFIQRVTVPSAMLSPIWGMMTLVGMGKPRSELDVKSQKSKVERPTVKPVFDCFTLGRGLHLYS